MRTGERTPLAGRRVLVVEDRYFIADEMRELLLTMGAAVIGPYPNVEEATKGLDAGPLDLALLDVNLEGEMVYRVAETLDQKGVPFIFVTGYDDWVLPEAWRARPRLTKPLSGHALTDEVLRVFGKKGGGLGAR